MNKTKIIAISIGIFILVFAVLVSVFGTVSRSMRGNSMLQNSFDDSVSMGLPSPSSSTFSSPMGGSQEKMATSGGNWSGNSQSETVLAETDKKVIKNGNLTLKVDDVDDAVLKIGKIAKDNGGDLFSSNFSKNSQDLKSGTLSVKVPVANFEKTFAEAKKVAAAVLRESTSGQDVTEQYQDLEGRIKNKQTEEAAYQKVLDQAQKISDILEVTQALSRVRGEIESLQGKLRYLASQTDMSTIAISMSEDSNITVSDSWRPWQVAKDATRSLVVKVQNFVDFLIVFVITFLPTMALYLVLFWIIYRIGKVIFMKIFKKKEEGNQ
ncbi:MAG: DUF4349 domain-containing protein [Candidatus Moraniibacteriota bacterium]